LAWARSWSPGHADAAALLATDGSGVDPGGKAFQENAAHDASGSAVLMESATQGLEQLHS